MMTIAAETKLWFAAPFARVRTINHLIFITNYEEFLNYVQIQYHENLNELLKSAILHFSGTEGNFIDIYINN